MIVVVAAPTLVAALVFLAGYFIGRRVKSIRPADKPGCYEAEIE